jgi:integrase
VTDEQYATLQANVKYGWLRALLAVAYNFGFRTLAKKAGMPDLIFHDLRRSAVRNMVRAGVSKHVAKLISGHQTDSVFDRYDITDETDLAEAARKMEARKFDVSGHRMRTETKASL